MVYGPYSSIKSAKASKAVPGSFRVINVTPLGSRLTWKAVVGVSGYEVWRSTSRKSGYSLVGTTGTTSYNDTELEMGKTYYYKVRMYLVDGDDTLYGNYTAVKSIKAK
jgi:fibronectin type 3 domain-containing protein